MERGIHIAQAKAAGRPEAIIESKILPGKMNAFFAEICLLEQGFVMDESTKIEALINGLASKIGEAVTVKRFVRMAVGA
jgi:elongation factor Ts